MIILSYIKTLTQNNNLIYYKNVVIKIKKSHIGSFYIGVAQCKQTDTAQCLI